MHDQCVLATKFCSQARLIVEIGKQEVWIDRVRFQTDRILQGWNCRRGLTGSYERHPLKIMQLGGLRVGVLGTAKRLDCALELLVGGEPTAQKDSVLCSGFCLKLCHHFWRADASGQGCP